jgi:hypothetical protein
MRFSHALASMVHSVIPAGPVPVIQVVLVARTSPLGLNATGLAADRVMILERWAVDHKNTSPGEAAARILPSGLKATPYASYVKPVIVAI